MVRCEYRDADGSTIGVALRRTSLVSDAGQERPTARCQRQTCYSDVRKWVEANDRTWPSTARFWPTATSPQSTTYPKRIRHADNNRLRRRSRPPTSDRRHPYPPVHCPTSSTYPLDRFDQATQPNPTPSPTLRVFPHGLRFARLHRRVREQVDHHSAQPAITFVPLDSCVPEQMDRRGGQRRGQCAQAK